MAVARQDDLYELDFPARMPEPIPVTPELSAAIGAQPREAYLGRDYMLVLDSEAAVRQLAPDFTAMAALPEGTGVLVTARGEGCDFVSRAFFPKLSVNEDPVTGSAHCHFIPFWCSRLGKDEMVARQPPRRGGTLYCRDLGPRVSIAGGAVAYLEGTLCL